ncbi:DJ-1/PfpI family protein [Providencia hangzhouensis]|nr:MULTISPECIES: DJ-1/PfpI family protein [Providencia]MBJ9969511.1 DJ-1/PfpI family protein [Providencia rettgeri]WOB97972.1 DJ-1/PfpI family protein [Providencia sp. PROV046]
MTTSEKNMSLNSIAIILFDNFETLDVMGPVEVFGSLKDCQIVFISPSGEPMRSSQGVTLNTLPIQTPCYQCILIPGGQGTRSLSKNDQYIQWVKKQAEFAETVISVCTGSALLAQTSLLNGFKATTNKLSYQWVTSLNNQVLWQPKARWFMIISFILHQALVQVLICHYRLFAIFMTKVLQVISHLKWNTYGIKMLNMIHSLSNHLR